MVMKMGELLRGLESCRFSGNLEEEILHVTYDSRAVEYGALFVAVEGFRDDGHAYIDEAIAKGAVAVVAERVVESEKFHLGDGPLVSLVVTPDSRRLMAIVGERFYGHPSQGLRLIGLTGTNGKTTTSYLVEAILKAAGRRPGLIGTIDYRYSDKVFPAGQTTPESFDLQRMLYEMVLAGVDSCVMEVSSHSLELNRVLGCHLDVALFTNLTRDHLDFHPSLEHYFAAKARLFTEFPLRAAVLNVDDPYGRRLAEMTRASVLTYGLGADADVRAEDVRCGLDGCTFVVRAPCGKIPIASQLVGEGNAYNLLAAVALAVEQQIDPASIREGIRRVTCVPGRFELVDEGQDFAVVVDYAHTEDALRCTLAAARSLTTRHLITVFGCGGDRDPGKRASMGAAAAEYSDVVIITSDNPRTEDPFEIIEAVAAGFQDVRMNGKFACSIPDRRSAIQKAITMATTGDVVVVAGKGHERYQVVGTRRIPFEDQAVARELLRQRVERRS